MGFTWEGKSFWWGVVSTAPGRIFSCNHQLTSGLSKKSRSRIAERPKVVAKYRTTAALADVVLRKLVKSGVGIRRGAISVTGKILVDVIRLEPKV
jgi:hypothetical protein